MVRVSFREQMLRVREDAIIDVVIRLLAGKGFDLMTVDEVAAEVGIAKASLYRHFESKEALAAAAMARLLERTRNALIDLDAQPDLLPQDRLQGIVRWAMQLQLSGDMPTLPAQNSVLSAALINHAAYMGRLVEVSDLMGAWIVAAQAAGALTLAWPAEVMLYVLFARACDPVPLALKATGRYSDEQIIEMCLAMCFQGLAAR